MFKGSRRRAPVHEPLTRETANPNAATAAASAFTRHDSNASNASLSSAAAAAALRARPTSPTNVADVQSKRMHRRNGSAGSTASRDRSRTRELQRTPSIGSMTDRTFRSPSPGRGPAPVDRDAPPVPSLPSPARIKTNDPRKSQTIQTQPFLTASQKQKRKGGQQGSWFGPAKTLPEDRPGSISPSSINFSYPRGNMRSPSPGPHGPLESDQTLVYDANSRRMVPRATLVAQSQVFHEPLEKPTRGKKQDISRAGSHLSKGTLGRTQAPALEANQHLHDEFEVAEVAKKPKTKKKKKKHVQQQQLPAEAPVSALSREQTLVEDDNDDEDVELVEDTRPKLVKKPSIVREEPEREEEEEREDQYTHESPVNSAQTTPVQKKHVSQDVKTPESRPKESVRRTRVQSESPARSAHFAMSSTDQLVIKHEPPPRSLSPRKSALKLSSSNRGVSPSDDGSDATSSRNLSPFPKEDSTASRKKTFRVSWDDKNTQVVGEANTPIETDSPIIPSPQATRKPWHSIVTKYAKKDATSFDEEESMSPRPALPLFGSVREKKAKEPEERPLVRPSELSWPSQPQSSADKNVAVDAGPSSDSAIGAILDQASKNEANISKYREPLPQTKSSVEGSGNESKEGFSSDEDELLDTDDTPRPRSPTDPSIVIGDPYPSAPKVEPVATQVVSEDESQEQEGPVPTISISHPSPRLQNDEAVKADNDPIVVPGGFPENGEVDATTDESATPVLYSVAEYDSDNSIDSTPTRSINVDGLASTPQMHDIVEEEEDASESCSVYSDAYEELDEDGDGFLSLDAVLETPTNSKTSRKLYEKAIAMSKEEASKSTSGVPTVNSSVAPVPDASDDWENAKAYWRSLSSEKRRQLEKEAMEEADEDADVGTPEPQPKEEKTAANGHAITPIEPVEFNDTNRVYQIQPGTKWTEDESEGVSKRNSTLSKATGAVVAPKLRQSMRTEDPARVDNAARQPGSMRKSMRSGAPLVAAASKASTRRRSRSAEPQILPTTISGTSMPKTLRATASNGSAVASRPSMAHSSRPTSYHSSSAVELAAQKHNSNNSGDGRNGMKSTLRRRGSDSSESSFTRARPRAGENQMFRRSMRESLREPPSTADGSGRFSLRSMSPPGMGFRRNSISSLPPNMATGMAAGRMRHSLRNDSTDNISSRKRMSAFGRPKVAKKSVKKAFGGSRFADSSDEDDGGRQTVFSSRFADSSDEDDVPRPQSKGKGFAQTVRPNRSSSNAAAAAMGVKPTAFGADSPEPDDGNDGLSNPKRGAPSDSISHDLRRNRSGRGTLMPISATTAGASGGAEPPRPAHVRRGSFMSILRRKKDPSGKISRDIGESAARRDTKLERTTDELSMIRSNSGNHKRGPSWPLADGQEENDDSDPVATGDDIPRPVTASGPPPALSTKSKFLRRRSASQGMVGLAYSPPPPDEDVPPLPDQYKKKKFGTLRKMFGLHD